MRAIQVAIAIGIASLLPVLAQMTTRFFGEPPEYPWSTYSTTPQNEKKMEQSQADYRTSTAEFNLKLFYVAFPMGVAELLIAYAMRKRTTIAAGIIFGSLLTFCEGFFSSWDTLPGLVRYASLIFLLALLIVVANAIDRHRAQINPPNAAG